MRLAIPKYSAMFKIAAILKYNALSKWELSLTLTGFFFLTDYSSVKLTSEKIFKVAKDCKYFTPIKTLLEASFDFFCITQIAKLLPNNDRPGS